MLHTLISIFFLFFVVCGIEGNGKSRKYLISQEETLIFSFHLGLYPNEIFAKVGSTFTISCSVLKAGGKLNFYEGEDLVFDEHIKV